MTQQQADVKCSRCNDTFPASELDQDRLCKQCARQKGMTTKEQCPYCQSKNVVRLGGSVTVPGGPLGEGYHCAACGRDFTKTQPSH